MPTKLPSTSGRSINRKDLGAGLIFTALGAWFAVGALSMERGTAFRMGPGYFPLVLAVLLVVLGLVIAVKSIGQSETPFTVIPWRGLILVLAPPILFGLTVRGLGLLPAVALVVIVSAFASRRMGLLLALALTVVITAFCVAVFTYGLGLPIPMIGPWIMRPGA